MTTINGRKRRLRAVLMIALALGAGSVTVSGALASLSSRTPLISAA